MSVSILIPAFRPTFLRQAIASALTQEGEDIEILISDDSGGDQVRAVVETYRDPRIRYVATAGKTGPGPNCRNAWVHAKHNLIKYLFDDDLLLPHCLAELVPHVSGGSVSAVFGLRYTIDAQGRITGRPSPLGKDVVRVGAAAMVASTVARIVNPIGELSNVLINADVGLTPDDIDVYRGFRIRVLGDVSFYLNASHKGEVVGVSLPVASFRRHAHQGSSPGWNPEFAVGMCEWELFLRGEIEAGALASEAALPALNRLATLYDGLAGQAPAIRIMRPGLDALRERISAGETDLLDGDFRRDWDRLIEAVEARKAGVVGA